MNQTGRGGLDAEAVAFVNERRLATLTTLRPDGSPHVVPVGFTYDPERHVIRIISDAGSRKVAHLRSGGRAAVCQVDGRRWITLEGVGRVTDVPAEVAEAVRRYALRYRPPRANPTRVAIEITVDRVLGRA